MASWDIQITVLNVDKKVINVLATRTDDAGSKIYTVARAPIVTAEQKLAVMDEIWAKHQLALARDTQIAAVVDTLQAQAKANLEARE